MIIDQYSRIKERIDLEYKPTVEVDFISRNFDKVKWSSTRQRNFFTIIKVLAENGYCTIQDIVNKDGLSQVPDDRKKRHDVYNRIIRGFPEKSNGLIGKGIIHAEEKDWLTKRNNHYNLSLFGVLYAISLFSKDPKYTKYEKSILDVLVENYSDMLPLIFGKWEFLISEFGTLVNFLIAFAHVDKFLKFTINHDLFFNSDVTHMHGWKSTGLGLDDELSMLFFAHIAMQDNHYKTKFSEDKKILEIYNEYFKVLRKRQHIELLRVRYKEAGFNGRYDEVKEIGLELIEIQGMAADIWVARFDLRPDMRD